MFNLIEKNQLKYLSISEFADKGIKTVFTTKLGGISSGAFSSLNMAFHTGDDPENVRKNREIICDAVGINSEELVTGEQIHGSKVQVVGDKERGKGALELATSISGVDALITNQPGLPLISFYADCVPLFLLDPVKKVVGLAHAGWKGTVLRIGAETVKKMSEVYGSRPADCWVGIGPSISRDNYEVDERVITHFKEEFSYWPQLVRNKGKGHYNLDLWLSNQLILEEVGVPADQIITSNYCTVGDHRLFYSYRADRGETGRMASIITL